MNKLEKLRKQIDEIDQNIINLIAQRMDIVKFIGEYKKKNNLAPLQLKRWHQILKSRKNQANKLNINPQLIENIWNNIHKEALKIEK